MVPMVRIQPSQSGYKAFFNNPLMFVDPDGKTEFNVIIWRNTKTGESLMKITTEAKLISGGIYAVRSWTGSDSYHLENRYFDYANFTILNYDPDKDETISYTKNNFIIDNTSPGMTRTLWPWSKVDAAGTIIKEDERKGEHGIERNFGFVISSDGGSGAQDISKNIIGSISLKSLSSILKRVYKKAGNRVKVLGKS